MSAAGRAHVEICSIVVAYGDTPELDSLSEQLLQAGSVIVVNNGDLISKALPKGVEIITPPSNLGYGAGVNFAVRNHRSARWYLICNSDVSLVGNVSSLRSLILEIATPVVAFSAVENDRSFGLLPSKRTTIATMLLGENFSGRAFEGRRVPKGSFFLVRADHFTELGGFDPRFFLYYEETDLFYRSFLRGARVCTWVDPQFTLGHRGAASTGRTRIASAELGHSGALFARKHGLYGWSATFMVSLLVLATRQMLAGRPTSARLSLVQLAAFVRTLVGGRASCADELFGSTMEARSTSGQIR